MKAHEHSEAGKNGMTDSPGVPQNRLKLRYPPELPISRRRGEIVQAIRRNRVVIISGETGCGKSTQIPKMCLEASRGSRGRIAVTQPRRIAAVTIAQRIAEEMGEPVGRTVGYKIRFEDRSSPETRIKVVTDGMLLAETQADGRLREYDTIIVDEAHERSLNIDFLLGIIKTLLAKRSDIKLVITSATLDLEKFAGAFEGAPVLQVGGRMYPVRVEYRVPDPAEKEDLDYVDMAAEAVDEIMRKEPSGDVLVFMPTEQDILETCEILEGKRYPGVTVLPLFARLPGPQQSRVYSVPSPKIVVATNVAETSLTIPGIKYVVDTGLARLSQYLPGAGINSLPIRPVSMASADQRKGRCGRVSEGLCVRLFDQEDYEARPRFTPPEILRSNLAEVILRMLALNLGHPAKFPFVDKPTARMIDDGFDTLVELGAVRKRGPDFLLTDRGRRMAQIPLDPRLSRMLIEAVSENCLREVAVVASALSIRDPRERPPEKAAQADACHAPFREPDSDFLTLLHIWDRYHGDWEGLRSTTQKRRFCREHFLSFPRMREWVYIHDQILEILREQKFPPGRSKPVPMSKQLYGAIHRAAAAGLLSHVAALKEGKIYTAARGREAMLFPGSSLFGKPPSWIVAAEIVQTGRLYIRTAARIEPGWLEALAGDLCHRAYENPRWDRNKGEVRADERVTLFGLEIVSHRELPFGPVDPEAAGKIFIRDALLAGEVKDPPGFLKHNLELHARFAALEEKMRRRDIVVPETETANFYAGRLAGIYDLKGLRKKVEKQGGDSFLFMGEEDVVRSRPAVSEVALYPDDLNFGGRGIRVQYRFLPGAEDDGATIRVKADLLPQLEIGTLEWGIPGYFREKIHALVKGLPQRYRKALVPAAERADVIVREMPPSPGSLAAGLSEFVHRRFRVDVPAEIWDAVDLPKHLKIRLSVLDAGGSEVAAGRDYGPLLGLRPKAPLADTGSSSWKKVSEQWERPAVADWDWDSIPAEIRIGGGVSAYPALVSGPKDVGLRLYKTAEEAAAAHPRGVEALLSRKFARDLKFMERILVFPEEHQRAALYFGGKAAVEKSLLEALRVRVFRRNIRDRAEYQAFADGLVKTLFAQGQILLETVKRALSGYQGVRADLYTIGMTHQGNKAVEGIVETIRAELEALMPRNFAEVYPPDRLDRLPAYLEALRVRAERAKNSPEKDRNKAAEIAPFAESLVGLAKRLGTAEAAEIRAALDEVRWMIEEFKIAVFAPEIGTLGPVSAKRLTEALREVRMKVEAAAPPLAKPGERAQGLRTRPVRPGPSAVRRN
jgi:ATP-dependent helicase HrpA